MSRMDELVSPARRGAKGPAVNAELLLDEVKVGLAAARLDCSCRERVKQILDRVTRARRAHQQRADLLDARQKRNGIAALLKLLAEIDEITGAEADLGVFEEAAALFEDIALLAAAGAKAFRRAGALSPSQF